MKCVECNKNSGFYIPDDVDICFDCRARLIENYLAENDKIMILPPGDVKQSYPLEPFEMVRSFNDIIFPMSSPNIVFRILEGNHIFNLVVAFQRIEWPPDKPGMIYFYRYYKSTSDPCIIIDSNTKKIVKWEL